MVIVSSAHLMDWSAFFLRSRRTTDECSSREEGSVGGRVVEGEVGGRVGEWEGGREGGRGREGVGG